MLSNTSRDSVMPTINRVRCSQPWRRFAVCGYFLVQKWLLARIYRCETGRHAFRVQTSTNVLYGSGTVNRSTRGQLADAVAYMHWAEAACASADGSTFLCEMTSWTPSWKCDIKSSIDAYLLEEQSWQISSRSDLKRRSLRHFWRSSPQQEEEERYGISSWSKNVLHLLLKSNDLRLCCNCWCHCGWRGPRSSAEWGEEPRRFAEVCLTQTRGRTVRQRTRALSVAPVAWSGGCTAWLYRVRRVIAAVRSHKAGCRASRYTEAFDDEFTRVNSRWRAGSIRSTATRTRNASVTYFVNV